VAKGWFVLRTLSLATAKVVVDTSCSLVEGLMDLTAKLLT
jgi:hypothetical protein